MVEVDEKDSSSFTIGNTAQERSLSYVPDCYVIPPSNRPSLAPETADVPVIDLAGLRQDAVRRAQVIKQIGDACRDIGFFQIVNHGICQSVLDGALSAASDFFSLPREEKLKLMSNDVYQPVRYGTSIKDGVDKYQFWRVFLKHYAYPLSRWIDLWPENPPDYREKMGKYCMEARRLALELIEAMTKNLGLGPTYLGHKIEEGMQVVAVNCYPPCPDPEKALGLPPHSDYTCLTIVLQNSPGLEVMDTRDGKWRLVPQIQGGLQVHVGDHLEVLSNGLFKSVVHKATLNSERTRISIASLHSLGMDDKMETAEELVDDQHPKRYKESSFRDFLNFLSNNDFAGGKSFLSTLKDVKT
ncbi:flavanone 3-dioxygenase 3 [Ricinus communis]|uniref:Hyoscyamine 6-dioxygenase, putative n=1 Tax=Ricinus communis TaxID=3988 RepID=B9R9Z7_RICCO|nr:flavanone 3-dioxygenase 3 [Ricinus communis]EEF51624.1 Hyoscyamine 6-dioxygenase, putative [Ricinus communis]|eukprot:XP_002511022.1 flavanone 3-dioxygenase 3 [Ricinus communis]